MWEKRTPKVQGCFYFFFILILENNITYLVLFGVFLIAEMSKLHSEIHRAVKTYQLIPQGLVENKELGTVWA